ncbi:TPA: hypothetical protein ACH3X2_009428 [Trebouxia sp. C0005]
MDTFGFESQYFDKGLGKVLTGLEQRVVSGLQQAASVVDEYPSQAPKGLSDAENTVAFWRLFDLQKRKGSLEEVKQSLQNLSLEQDGAQSLQRRAQLAEAAFLDIAEILSSAPDPTPLLSAAGALKASVDALQQQNRQIELEAVSSKVVDAEVQQLSARLQQAEATASEMQNQVTTQVQANQDLQTSLQRAQLHEAQANRLQEHLQRLQAELQKVQAEHHKSQNTLFELTSQKEERETSRQHEADQAAMDLEEAHKKLRQGDTGDTAGRLSLKRERDLLQQRLDAQQEANVVPQASSAESELEVKGLQAQISQSEELLQAAQASHAEDTSRLQQDLESTQQQLNATQEELASHPQPEELQRLQQRITMLQAMVDSPEEAEAWDAPQGERLASSGGTMTSSTLHRILQERNRKLNAELTKLKNSTTEQQGDIQNLQQQLQKARSHDAHQKALIKQLELDLMHSSVKASLSPESHTAEEMDAEANSLQDSDTAGSPGSQATGAHLQPKLLGIVTSQRDRFHAQVLQLEEEVATCRRQVQQCQGELAGKEADNVSLYEKIRYLQRYSSNRQASSGDGLISVVQVDDAGVTQPKARQAHRMSCGPFSVNYGGEAEAPAPHQGPGARSRTRRRATCFGGDEDDYDQEAGGRAESDRKYKKAYEARLNPFVEFQQHETESHVNKLNLHDRALLSGSRLMLANKAVRFFVVAYAVLLHLFVFGVVYFSAWSSSQLQTSATIQ